MMMPRDLLILAAFFLICTLLYLAIALFPRHNRTRTGRRAVLLGALGVLCLSGMVWHIVFASPISRNWGLGGSYLWMAVCPALYLLIGLAVTCHNLMRKEHFHD